MKEYKGLRVEERVDSILVYGVKDFDPVHTFECGQCFRWNKLENGNFFGVAGGRAVELSYKDSILELKNSTYDDFVDFWYDYFDFGRDYSHIKKILSQDPIMKTAIEFGGGIRILKQEFHETLVSFITSANNGIPRIMKTIEVIAKEYGDEIDVNSERYFSFPKIEKLSKTSLENLSICKGGFRCRYILQSSIQLNQGDINIDGLKKMTTDEARKELMKLPGVGPKVADCILLYSGTKQDVFPTDVWVKRVMEELYFKREATFKEIQDFAAQKFGNLTGFAQQYLFYYARENKIGTGKRK